MNGDLLQLTGRAQILGDREVTVRMDIEEVRATPAGTSVRFELVEPFPGNP